MADISERNLEDTIEQYLLAFGLDQDAEHQIREEGTVEGPFQFGGYHRRGSGDYDRDLCLIPSDLLDFVKASQPQQWDKLRKQYKNEAEARLLKRVSAEIGRRGTLHVLRNGIREAGARIQLYYAKPVTGLNPEVQNRYLANVFSVVRQLRYGQREGDETKSLDLVLFLNGLPLFTAELKARLTGQTVQHAIKQYQRDRDPREPLFALGRCLVHFAVDDELVYFTTQLQGEDSYFLPFNRGNNRGAGNPPSYLGFATAYLWEQVWARDAVLNLIQSFIYQIEEEHIDQDGHAQRKELVIFPRYHQLDAVRRLITHAREHGPGQRYLIQHSAGSGKSYSISWLAHQLSKLHNTEDQRVFDSVIVVTDRRVLDQQLQQHVGAFEQVRGLVAAIGPKGTSADLRIALEQGKDIIVTTIQKFPFIVEEVKQLTGQRFAVIIDEAHSSQGGETAHQMQQVLEAGSLEAAADQDGEPDEDWEDRVEEAARTRGLLPNVSYFAFTATPKTKTLELFGTSTKNGEFEPFDLYSMRQAIEEKFILDVLENYTTYKTYWNLLKKIEDDPQYEQSKANYVLKAFVDLHEHTVDKKVQIIIEHFVDNIMHQIDGRAKVMIVTRSRLHAVRYKLAVDSYLRDQRYGFQSLVAFSGTVKDPDSGENYTEASMNTRSAGQRISENMTADTFGDDPFRIMIVAEKFQTGFDQPLLQAMYVDKKLAGLHAVQTLSRLNRIYSEKEGVFVLDFANEAEDIQAAFQPYYDKSKLDQPTDPNLLYEFETELAQFKFYSREDLDQFARLFFSRKGTQPQLIAILEVVVGRLEKANQDERDRFKKLLRDYVRVYSFLTQIISYSDADLEKLYVFARYLIKVIPPSEDRLPQEITEAIDLRSLRIQKTGSGKIDLERGTVVQRGRSSTKGKQLGLDDLEKLSKIIEEINERFGADFLPEDVRIAQYVEDQLDRDLGLQKSVLINTPENARLTFDDAFSDILQTLVESHFKFYKRITDDKELGEHFKTLLFERFRDRLDESAT